LQHFIQNPSWRKKLPFADEPRVELAVIQAELTTDEQR
jgi:hypothetical protein